MIRANFNQEAYFLYQQHQSQQRRQHTPKLIAMKISIFIKMFFPFMFRVHMCMWHE